MKQSCRKGEKDGQTLKHTVMVFTQAGTAGSQLVHPFIHGPENIVALGLCLYKPREQTLLAEHLYSMP